MNLDAIFAEFYDAAASQKVTFDALLRLGQQVGFDNANLNVIEVTGQGHQRSIAWQTSYSERWVTEMSALPAPARQEDPILAHLGRRSDPLIWDRTTYQDVDLYARFSDHGIASGVAAALPLSTPGQRLLLGFSAPDGSIAESRHLGSQVAALMLAASLATRAFDTSQPEESLPCPLSPRELEVLKWVRDGKSTWEIGVILAISEGTVANHVRKISEKLGVASRTQAVVKAMRHEWL